MSMNASQDTRANPSKDSPACPERDTREGAQDDSSTVTQSNPPTHGLPTHGVGRFLWEVPKGTPISELGELYERWQDDTEQADLQGWEK